MKVKDFNKLVMKNISDLEDILVKKQREYNLIPDRLSVFKDAAKLQKITPELALLGFVSKQIISIYDMVKSENVYDYAVWNEKLLDIQAYMILLKALLKDTGRSFNE